MVVVRFRYKHTSKKMNDIRNFVPTHLYGPPSEIEKKVGYLIIHLHFINSFLISYGVYHDPVLTVSFSPSVGLTSKMKLYSLLLITCTNLDSQPLIFSYLSYNYFCSFYVKWNKMTLSSPDPRSISLSYLFCREFCTSYCIDYLESGSSFVSRKFSSKLYSSDF